MRYEHTPRPNVEHHHHIQMLIEAQDKRVRERTEFRERRKNLEDREDLIRDSALECVYDFWCDTCQEDFKAQTIREIEEDWSNAGQRIAFYRTKHFCGAWVMRFITDRHRDPYWFRSKRVKHDRSNHRIDVLQPFEEGYNLMFGKPK